MNPLEQVATNLGLTAIEYQQTAELLRQAGALSTEAGIAFDEHSELGLANHLASLIRRLDQGERLSSVDTSLFDQVPRPFMDLAERMLQPLYDRVGQAIDLAEIGLVALHFAAAHERAASS